MKERDFIKRFIINYINDYPSDPILINSTFFEKKELNLAYYYPHEE
jgi:hypothetical protein